MLSFMLNNTTQVEPYGHSNIQLRRTQQLKAFDTIHISKNSHCYKFTDCISMLSLATLFTFVLFVLDLLRSGS